MVGSIFCRFRKHFASMFGDRTDGQNGVIFMTYICFLYSKYENQK